MRTTIDLPDVLMRVAKIRAAERGESLTGVFTRALESELGQPMSPPSSRKLDLPLIARDADPVADLSTDELRDALDAEHDAQ